MKNQIIYRPNPDKYNMGGMSPKDLRDSIIVIGLAVIALAFFYGGWIKMILLYGHH